MTLNIPALTETWQSLDRLAHPAAAPIETDTQLAEATTLLEELLTEIGENPRHPLGNLARLLIDRITRYEAEHHPIPDADGAAMLAFYLDQRGLTQQQLAAATGLSQGTISRLLTRKRPLTADHARSLAQYFGVSPAIFL